MYSREIDGQVLTLSSSGWTYRNTFVLFDYETETMWYHLPGDTGLTGISGVYRDRKLEELESRTCVGVYGLRITPNRDTCTSSDTRTPCGSFEAAVKFHGLHDKTDDDDMGHVAVRAGGSTWPLTPTRMSRAVPGAHTI